MSNFAMELFELGAKITAPSALTNLELQTRQQRFDYIAKLSGNGSTNLRVKDAKPLQSGVAKVLEIMSDHEWYSVPRLRELTGMDQADRRMRELRDHGYTVDKRRIQDSRSFEYRLRFDCKM
jgi:hypothetical protein